jgi:diguanylate cyclase (GGDEF)-like protein
VSDTTILVIDDESSVHQAVRSHLEDVVDEILSANGPGEGIRLATQRKPDVILLDINMPDMDGYKVCRHLKENSATRDIPILFLTVDRNVEHLAKALDCGGSDYILKPFNTVELEARVRAALRTRRLFELLREQARIDALTGLSNRAAMDDALRAAVSSHQRLGQPMALLMLDLDNFKHINDSYGHGVGDDLLREVGATLRGHCRPYDVPCRFGGDEFAVILGQIEGAYARQAAARIMAGIAEISMHLEGEQLNLSSSAGLISSCDLPEAFDPEDLLKAADAALYDAKKAGRSRMVISAPDSARVDGRR